MTDHPLRERALQAPEQPGVYQFLDGRGKVLYVGKARHLRRRVLSYFGKELPPRIAIMVARARGLEFVVTATEVEALILENRLIKQHRPRYNVLLRDDKTYPYVKLTTGEAWPRAYLTRRVQDDGHRYFGPFMGRSMAARIMDLIRTRTQVRTCNLEIDGSAPRPCLYHAMGACLAPCVAGMTTSEAYAEAVEEVVWLLEGRHAELRPRLEAQMWRASEAAEFERAARYRDLVRALEGLREGQHVEMAGTGSVDVLGIEGDGRDLTAVVLVYREGRLVDKREYHWEGIDQLPDAELVAGFLTQYYDANPAVPERVEVPMLPEAAEAVAAYLQGLHGGKVAIVAPRRGPRARVAALAAENAREAFRLRFRHPRRDADRIAEAVAHALGLPAPVRRIECFDVSHLHGEDQVVSVVVWERGRMAKGEARSFNVRAGRNADDPAAIAEAVGRRYRRRAGEGRPLPDLVLVDGGPAQLAAAREALEGLGVELPVAALAKKLEELYLPGRDRPLQLGSGHPVRLLLQRVRDEAHRVAVTRHRRRRKSRRLATQLLAVPGIGPVRARELLVRFGSVDGVRAATRSELAAVVGERAAAALWAALH
ncbi:MAG TPA: excinuclease ABC subunit UvrC [Thermoanaerobaculaceae bacterium]|nr:excinuclease ABC subunit UvrC [Thermoanaerobaculaceae bacterium]HRS15749.1 excinuclease ABC subunit UvrC [Thermoanaerobaculaceae bacterium]